MPTLLGCCKAAPASAGRAPAGGDSESGGRQPRRRRSASNLNRAVPVLESLAAGPGRADQGPCEYTILIEINSILIIFYTIMILKFECDQFTINLVLRRLNRH